MIINVYIGIGSVNCTVEGRIVCFYIDGASASIYIDDRTAVFRHVIILKSKFMGSVASVIPRIFRWINYDEKRFVLIAFTGRDIIVLWRLITVEL